MSFPYRLKDLFFYSFVLNTGGVRFIIGEECVKETVGNLSFQRRYFETFIIVAWHCNIFHISYIRAAGFLPTERDILCAPSACAADLADSLAQSNLKEE
ncbi:hypothetical protein VK72_21270 [Paenibacillus polymyxa]|uniref:Uncharacterized protein n=2 Tax=Paenibacillus TaxID=44249 RepID=A0ABX2Z9C5_PAEPO|nr:hypothetical protein ABE82_20540 [Paenibacillus peoriae]APQ61034.1 hypothetical protein VK72_21270 [Paenibacillus polymyxa]KJD46304.1 hypothetical protein QD47_06990 [Paenibacillus terrae]ODA06735.1 hypothetical protein A7312_14290 [Paenibacillus polymyxa]ODB61297.1 hypothetical protein A7309_15585 [Paenibacillus polymyxa]